MNELKIITDKEQIKKVVNMFLDSINAGEIESGDLSCNTFTDVTGFHETYELESPTDNRAFLILQDPKFCTIQAFEGMIPVLVYMDKNSEYVPSLIERIKQLKEAK